MTTHKNRSFILAFLAFAVSSSLLLPAQSVQETGKSDSSRSGAAGAASFAAPSSALPLSSVVLYVSGVGFFQREGKVSGNQDVELSFKNSQLNDLLKSLTVRDLDGGRVTGVTYGSQDPMEKQLRSFAVNLSGAPGLLGILSQLRGERIKLGLAEAVEGILVGIDSQTNTEGLAQASINILSPLGLRSFALKDIQYIGFANSRIDTEFRKALGVLAESHDADKRTVRIGFQGKGERRVSLSYLSEAPTWKTAYRLVLDGKGDHFLQAWAIVENSSDEDWKQVSLSLVSGRPISFIMDLSSPRYVQRPLVQQNTAAGPAPQTYDAELSAPPSPAPSPMRASESMKSKLMVEREDFADDAAPETELSASNYGAGVSSYGSVESEGSLVRYKINVPVNLERRESAMFPLVDGKVSGNRVSVYDKNVDGKRPLLGVELVNSTPFTLLAGPITVFDSSSYAGDALIEDLVPNAKRLLTYAVDMESEVAPGSPAGTETIVAMTASKGLFRVRVSSRREQKYTIKNEGDSEKNLIIVHPLDTAWTLLNPVETPETTRDTYRFRVPVAAHSSKTFEMAEERQIYQSFGLTDMDDARLRYYSSNTNAQSALKKAFATIIEKRSALQDLVASRKEKERKLSQFKEEQSRIRSNMNSISSSSDLYKKYLGMLNTQEGEIANLLEAIDADYSKEKALNKDLKDYIVALEIN